LSKISHNHAFCHASSQSSAWKLSVATRCFQIQSANSSSDRADLVAGANFALGWMRKWHPRLNYCSMSLNYPSGGASLRVHLENTLQPARRIIARLLREDAAFFREHHYLDPMGVDDSDNPML
jgi:hypothetical protein